MMTSRKTQSLALELSEFAGQFESAKDEARRLTDGLSDAQFNWRPEPQRWSMAECLSHLTMIGSFYLPRIDAGIEQATAKGWAHTRTFRLGPLWRLVVWLTEPPPRLRRRALKPFAPAPVRPVAEGLAEFLKLQDDLVLRVFRTEGLDISRPKTSSLISRHIRMSLGEGFALLAAHQRRHLWQAGRVRQSPGFPRA